MFYLEIVGHSPYTVYSFFLSDINPLELLNNFLIHRSKSSSSIAFIRIDIYSLNNSNVGA